MSHFFISYQRNSLKFAQELAQRIGDAGLLPWIDQGMQTGDEWKQVIDTAIQKSLGLIVVITPDALKSQYVTYEWSYAMGCGRTVLPLIREFPDPNNPDHPKIHPKINDRNYRDFTNPNEEDWNRLIFELNALQSRQYVPQPIQEAKTALLSFNRKTRFEAILALEQYEHQQAIEALAEAIETSRYPDILIDAGIALAMRTKCADSRAVPGLIRALSSEELHRSGYEKQEIALTALVTMNNEPASDALGNYFLNMETEENRHRSRIRSALCEFTDVSVKPYLVRAIQLSEIAEWDILEALAKFEDLETTNILFSCIENGKVDGWQRTRLAQIILLRNHPKAIEINLEEIVRLIQELPNWTPPYNDTPWDKNRLGHGEKEILEVIEKLIQVGSEEVTQGFHKLCTDVRIIGMSKLFEEALVSIKSSKPI